MFIKNKLLKQVNIFSYMDTSKSYDRENDIHYVDSLGTINQGVQLWRERDSIPGRGKKSFHCHNIDDHLILVMFRPKKFSFSTTSI
jgi:hypothetical protein